MSSRLTGALVYVDGVFNSVLAGCCGLAPRRITLAVLVSPSTSFRAGRRIAFVDPAAGGVRGTVV
jgi:hypothetical protein